MSTTAAFSPAEVRLIRAQADAGTLSVREWATRKRCSLETVRRVARRETYRDIPDARDSAAEPSPDELAAALAALTSTPALEAPQVQSALDEMMKKGK